MDLEDSLFKGSEVIINKIGTSDHEGLSCYKISMAFLFCVALVSLVAGALRLTQDYIISRQSEASRVVAIEQAAVNQDLRFVDSTPAWRKFIKNTNPFILSAVQAASVKTSLLDIAQVNSQEAASPLIRVGLFYTTRPHIIRATGNYQIITAAGQVVLTSQGDKATSIWYDWGRKLYYYQHQNISQGFSQPFQVKALADSALEIVTYSNPPKWNKSLKDNRFRGALELMHSAATGRVWMINELPLEDYLKGLGETRMDDNSEYLKVMTVVGRSYAYWHMLDNYKHQNEHFNVDAYWDQVYRGYDNEIRHPELVQAVENTYGEVVTYQGEVAVTPYFARSNGRTRDWSEVWFGDPYPWIKSVEVPQEKGFEQLGHGVGLSAVGAMLMAEEGKNYKDIIEYFYNEVSVEPAY